jgi:hypothetical protein
MSIRTDGSAKADAPDPVVIDRTKDVDRMRFVCPNGHTTWDRTNNHVWCRMCRRACEHGEDVDPEHYELLDKATGETIPWSAVRLAADERHRHVK